jgi:hypothetical protein
MPPPFSHTHGPYVGTWAYNVGGNPECGEGSNAPAIVTFLAHAKAKALRCK